MNDNDDLWSDEDNTVVINLTDEEFLTIAKMAHDLDITFNQMVNRALAEFLVTTSECD
jgi:hypothetical protein